MSATYLAVHLSVDGTGIVHETMLPGPDPCRPNLAYSLTALDARGVGFATEWIGTTALLVLPLLFPACVRLRPHDAHVKAMVRERDAICIDTADPPTRPAHLRLHVADDPGRLLLVRDHPLPLLRRPPACLLLATLALCGTRAATRRLGRAVLDELAALHPDLLTIYPALYAGTPDAERSAIMNHHDDG